MKTLWLSRLHSARTPRRLSTSRRTELRRGRPTCEALEGRQLMSGFTVSNTNDSGPGSLRQAILDSDANPPVSMVYSNGSATAAVNSINFSLPGGTQTISPLSPLPAITQPVLLQGPYTGSQPPSLVIDGSKAGPTAVGLDIQASSSTISYLTVKNFGGGGAILDGSIDDFLESDNFGPGNGAFGVEFRGGASSNELFLDNISGNSGNAIVLNGSTTANNVLEFNTIASNGANGVVLDGSSSNYIAYNTITSNGGSGVDLLGGASHNTLTGNTLSANQYYGLYLSDPGTTANLVQGSFIGTDSSGNVAEGNGSDGVRVTNMASGNTIGGTSSGQRNIISGNHGNGVVITGSGTTGNMVEGDYIGTNAAGTGRLGNLNEGVVISQGASSNTVGGYYAYTGSRNVISANQDYGVYLTGTGTNSNTIENNFIGTDASGTHALGNVFGVMIDQGASYNTVYMDVLSGNMCGIAIFGPGTTGNFVYSDQIGTDVTETAALGNTWYGVYTYQSSGNYIDFNVIAYNGFGVISLATDQNYYYGNGIGGNLYADNYTF